MNRPLFAIAREIRNDWRSVNRAAEPYLAAMAALTSIREMYFGERGDTIVFYFLVNASTWRGPVAEAIKAELQTLLRGV